MSYRLREGCTYRTTRLVGWRGLYRACYKVFRTKGGEREGLRWFGEHRKVEGQGDKGAGCMSKNC